MEMTDGFLHKYFLNNPDKRLHKWIHYFDIYERHFTRFRNKAPVMIEIGVFGGGSLAMWKEFFGAGSRIIGVDINPQCKAHEAEGIEIFIGSQDDPALIDQIFRKYPEVDIVLDDGSHVMNHMIASFELMYDRLHKNGIYMVEDTHTCYWPEYQGGVGRPGSFIEFAKNKIDELNAVHSRGKIPISSFTKSTDYIACYDSIVAFERRPQGHRQAPITCAMVENPAAI
ncbi:CmcI family methyltransferase [Paraburkholderia guartelaensis]|uniref:CmcI family methyltransferase n=1 Tax=Paraburkholderia guartelaensis TaxID=2546446 RepID=UPI002AB5E727|nr:CmcI family methyltransferase [Paraburkholderia guartelaensis]